MIFAFEHILRSQCRLSVVSAIILKVVSLAGLCSTPPPPTAAVTKDLISSRLGHLEGFNFFFLGGVWLVLCCGVGKVGDRMSCHTD